MHGTLVVSRSRQPTSARQGLAAPPVRGRAEHPPDTTPEMKPWCSATRRHPELPPFPRQVAIANDNLSQPGDLKAQPAGVLKSILVLNLYANTCTSYCRKKTVCGRSLRPLLREQERRGGRKLAPEREVLPAAGRLGIVQVALIPRIHCMAELRHTSDRHSRSFSRFRAAVESR